MELTIRNQDILNTFTQLPRNPKEAGIITISLKRNMEYKDTHMEKLIEKKKIFKYLQYLKNMKNKPKISFMMIKEHTKKDVRKITLKGLN